MSEPVITACRIGPGQTAELFAALGMTDPHAVHVTYDDGTTAELFEFYSDELSFTPDEFLGLTAEQGRKVHFDRDVAYLRAP